MTRYENSTDVPETYPRRTPSASRWLLVLTMAIVVSGCGKGEEAPPPQEEEGGTEEGYEQAMGGSSDPAPPKDVPKEEELVLPEDITTWVTEDYYAAKKKWDERLVEAVTHLGEKFTGTDAADSAAVLLTNLLKKSEEPIPQPSNRRGSGGSGGYGEEMGSGSYEEGMEGSGDYMEDSGNYEEEMGGSEGMYEEGYEGSGSSGSGSYGTGRAAQPTGVIAELVEALVNALGANGSDTAKQTLKQVVDGDFETDNNRVATLTTVGVYAKYLTPDYEQILLRILTSPESFRELGKGNQPGRRGPGGGSEEYDSGYMSEGMQQPGTRGNTGSPLTAEELQSHAFSLIAPKASEDLRVQLARHLASPNSPQEDHDLFGGYIRELDPKNVPAQMVLLSDPNANEQTKADLYENFLAYSSDALSGILGLPKEFSLSDSVRRKGRRNRPGSGDGMYGSGGMYGSEETSEESDMYGSGGMDEGNMYEAEESGYGSGAGSGARGNAGSGRRSRYDRGDAGQSRPSRYGETESPQEVVEFEKPDPDLPYRLARSLWTPSFTGVMANRLLQAGSLQSDPQLVLLAGTMPVDSVRSALCQALQANWEEGPGALESAGLLDAVITDPAFLALVKTLPRTEPVAGAAPGRMQPGRMQPNRTGSGGMGEEDYMEGSGSGGMEQPGAGRRGVARSGDPGSDWMAASEDLLRALCERLEAAAMATQMGQQSPENRPLELHHDARVTAEYRIDWPGEVQGKLEGVSVGSMKLHYIRAEQDVTLRTAEGFYRRKLGTPKTRATADGGMWMESYKEGEEAGWKRSLDVLVLPRMGNRMQGGGLDEALSARQPAGLAQPANQPVPMVTNILCIDIKDPAPPAAEN